MHTEAGYKAHAVDTNYNAWDPHAVTPGSMTQRLHDFGRVEGLVVGAYGEASPDLIKLINRLVNKASQTRHRHVGFDSVRSARSTIK